jgi:hypothetical protein
MLENAFDSVADVFSPRFRRVGYGGYGDSLLIPQFCDPH